ncbi:glycoside hydrolase family 5 protein [Mucilaginibacter flavus]|uniref:glycoside hydrolase family 5 protein n=1 Tax=Mucilaginibacter flavus TaxID=931504 RepID=UPI0025B36917|nr:cellulase family glycosylhydrolase [Mucilaginibacter flavus]MDN3581496.1 cellulase family glycosylhydrolase [Mucilaginibacter flavus]
MLTLLFLTINFPVAKSSPKQAQPRVLAFKRAKSLDNGVSFSWLEQTWNKAPLGQGAIKDADFKLLKKLGYKSLRLPIAFAYFENGQIPTAQLFIYIDKVVKQSRKYGFKLVLDLHNGNLNDTNYTAQTAKIINIWLNITKRYASVSADDLLFELYNEPPHMNPDVWKDAAYNIVTALRKVDKTRTYIIGASNYNSIYELSRFVRLADENIIYTFHFYEPFFFTHQGAAWIGNQVATTGVTFPYSAENFPALNPNAKGTPGESHYNLYPKDGNERSVNDKLQIVKNWGNKYAVPIICGEYGVYNKYADLDSRCRYIKAVRAALKRLNIPGMMWDYNSSFSIFAGPPSILNLPTCMQDAIGYNPIK